jgi:Na+-translocating ferredoxin:NAD+ oxidoreductase RnfC subunit
MSVVEDVKSAGIVGAGGAGFPTHIKIGAKAEYVIGNGAECEPLLRVDQQVMALFAEKVIDGLRLVMDSTGAKQGVIALKEHYHDAIGALQRAIGSAPDMRLHIMKSYYPAGDEQQIAYEVTGKVVPTGGLPLDVGAVISNVSTLVNISEAVRNKAPVTEKYVTIGGGVSKPVTVNAPIGAALSELVKAAGGVLEDSAFIVGGPCMGNRVSALDAPVTKTTGGLLAIPKDHPLLGLKTPDMSFQRVKAICCQCTMCSQMCPRNSLGLHVEPHKVMRSIAQGKSLIENANGDFSCCDCGICTYYACNFGLKPAAAMSKFKASLSEAGIKPVKETYYPVDKAIETKRLPVSRLIGRLGLTKYDVPAPIRGTALKVDLVRIPLKMHVGAPSVPVVKVRDKVVKGALIADIPEKALGARIHASIDGEVTDVTSQYIEIRN